MKPFFIVISTCLALISTSIYIKAIFKGNAKPHRTTRIVFLFITILTTLSLFAQHDTVAIWLAAISTIQSVFIFLLSIKYGMGGWARKDLLCLVIAFLGILLWQTTKNPTLALYAAIAADFIGIVPTLIKTYRLPHTEIWAFYFLDVFAGMFSLLAVRTWSVQEFIYPTYIMLINLFIALLVIRPALNILFKRALSS